MCGRRNNGVPKKVHSDEDAGFKDKKGNVVVTVQLGAG